MFQLYVSLRQLGQCNLGLIHVDYLKPERPVDLKTEALDTYAKAEIGAVNSNGRLGHRSWIAACQSHRLQLV